MNINIKSPVKTVTAELSDEAATRLLAAKLASITPQGGVILLFGDLGVGKTALARAFIIAKCGSEQEVPSPTFTLVQTYEYPEQASSQVGTLYHFDLYRLSSPDEAYELGIEDAFNEGISLIEWPDRLDGNVPDERLEITLSQGDNENSRRVEIAGSGAWTDHLDGLWPEGKQNA